jgi:citronellol/citronellal dehydrogenase
MVLLRAGLLSGRNVALAGDVSAEMRSALTSLGASLSELPPGELDDDQAQEWVRSVAPVHALVAATGEVELAAGGRLESALDPTWTAVRAVTAGALIPQADGGKIVLLGPTRGAGEHEGALGAGIENLVRTLSVEWARYGVTVTAVSTGASTNAAHAATVVGYLLSPAGDYFSGCRLALGIAGG